MVNQVKSMIFLGARESDSPKEHKVAICHNRTDRLIAARRILQKCNIPIRYDESRMDMSLSLTKIPVKTRSWFSVLGSAIGSVLAYIGSVTSIFKSSASQEDSTGLEAVTVEK